MQYRYILNQYQLINTHEGKQRSWAYKIIDWFGCGTVWG